MRVSALQMTSQDNVQHNLAQARELLERAKNEGASLAVLPEGFAFLGRDGDKRNIQESLDGDIVRTLREQAKRLRLAIVGGGFAEESSEFDRPYNTSVAIDDRGEILATYRKVHLFDIELADGTSFCESRHTMPGDEGKVVSLGGFGVGLAICYDLRFPELFARERQRGAEILTLPAAFTKTTGAAHWHALLRARAIETQCYVVAAGQSGPHPGGRETFGHSLVIDPWGKTLAELPEGVGVITAEVDRSYLEDVRTRMPVLAHRRI